MRKPLIIAIIIAVLIAGVSIYSCMIKKDSNPEQPVGGIYTGQVVAVGQDFTVGYSIIYWADKDPLAVKGIWNLDIGNMYVVNTKEVDGHLEIIGIQIKQ